jgi:hypothetical protein
MTLLTFASVACAAVASLPIARVGALERSAEPAVAGGSGLALVSARLTIEGTSNLHPYTASTTAVRVTALQLAGAAGGDVIQRLLEPGAIETFDLAVAAMTLTSLNDGIDKNMHKALKAQAHADIRFRLRSLGTRDASGDGAGVPLRAKGVVTIAGVDRDVMLDLVATRAGANLSVTGGVCLLMTDFGIAPPKAMLGMLKTDPKVDIRFEIVLAPA